MAFDRVIAGCSVIDDPGAESKVHQGVTTDVVGNCGSSPYPAGLLTPEELQRVAPISVIDDAPTPYQWTDFNGWAERVEGVGVSMNLVSQVGHSVLRQAARATQNRPANEEELGVMKRLVAESVEQGAIALTTALTGPPAMAAPASEIASSDGAGSSPASSSIAGPTSMCWHSPPISTPAG